MKPRHVYCEIYRMNFYFFIGWDFEAFKTYFSKHHDYDIGKKADGKTLFHTDGLAISIWTREKGPKPALVHESVHAANATLSQRGFEPDFENDEAQTYLAEWIFKKALESK